MLSPQVPRVNALSEGFHVVHVGIVAIGALLALAYGRPPMAVFLLLAFGIGASAQTYDSTRYTKSSVGSWVYQACNVYQTVAFGTNIPAGTYNLMTSSGTDASPKYTPGGYNVTKTAALGTAQNVNLAMQTFNAAQDGVNPGAGVPYYSSADFTCTGVQNHLSSDAQPFAVSASANKVLQGVEWRDSSVPGWYANGQTTNPTVYNWTITIGTGANVTKSQFTIQVASQDNKAHAVALVYNGTSESLGSLAASGTAGKWSTLSVDLTQSPSQAGDQWSVTVDGVSVASGVIPASAFLEGQTTYNVPTVQYVVPWSAPASNNTPQGAQTNGGNTTTETPGPTTSLDSNGNPVTAPDVPTTAVNNGSTSISGTSAGATNQDIYNDVYHALEDAGHDGTGYNTPSLTALNTWASNVYNPPDSTSGVPTGEDAKSMATDIMNNWGDIKASITGMQNDVVSIQNTANGLMPSIGGVPSQTLTFAFATPSALFGVSSFNVDATPYQTIIQNFRLVCSVALGVLMFYAFVRYARASLADLSK